eukprot:9502225-Pyramimonas_sp.AAC.2
MPVVMTGTFSSARHAHAVSAKLPSSRASAREHLRAALRECGSCPSPRRRDDHRHPPLLAHDVHAVTHARQQRVGLRDA